jgi:hypothetical protein
MGTVPLYGRDGRTVAFLLDGRRIISLRGRSLAWIKGGGMYDYQGRHLGFWEGTHARGSDGGLLLWTPGSATGLILPVPQIPPIAPIPSIEPIRPIPSLPPIRPLPRRAWSNEPFRA